MARIPRLTLAVLVVVVGLVPATTAHAGYLANLFGCSDCPPPDYSPLRYSAPRSAKAYDCIHGPRMPVYASEIHPDIAPGTYKLRFPCPAAAAVDTLIPPPTPPATSRFRY